MQRSIGRWMGIATGFVALAIATPALAQDGAERMRTHDPEKRIEKLDEMLDLTEAQEAEIRAIFAEQAEKGRELRGGGDREGMRAHMRQMHERVASVLTEEQRQKLETLREEHRGERHQRGERRHAPDDAGHRDQPGVES